MSSAGRGRQSLRAARVVLFDLDGTLVHSLPDLALSIDETLSELRLPQRGEAAVGDWVGDGVAALVKRALTNDRNGEPDAELFALAMPTFMRRYAANNGRLSRPYTNALLLLSALRDAGRRLGCVTNKSHAFTHPLLHKLRLHEFFDCIVSGDQVAQKKPHPDVLLAACRRIDAPLDAAVLVGDSRNDVQAARAAGIPVVCVSYGYNQGEDIRDTGPDAVVDDLSEVAGLLGIRLGLAGSGCPQ